MAVHTARSHRMLVDIGGTQLLDCALSSIEHLPDVHSCSTCSRRIMVIHSLSLHGIRSCVAGLLAVNTCWGKHQLKWKITGTLAYNHATSRVAKR